MSVTPDGCDLLSADSGEDAVAIFALSREKPCGPAGEAANRKVQPFELVGRIPTGSYPTVAAATPNSGRLVWVSARGLWLPSSAFLEDGTIRRICAEVRAFYRSRA